MGDWRRWEQAMIALIVLLIAVGIHIVTEGLKL